MLDAVTQISAMPFLTASCRAVLQPPLNQPAACQLAHLGEHRVAQQLPLTPATSATPAISDPPLRNACALRCTCSSDGERQDGSTWHGRKAPGFGPPGMHDTLLAAEEANEMVKSFQNGIRHAGWLYKLIGKTPSDMNWKRYWVRSCRGLGFRVGRIGVKGLSES